MNKNMMYQSMENSKVQFFLSESSFGSSSLLSDSRARDLAEQLTDETEFIFNSLKQSLLPRQDLIDQDKIQHIVHRAKILSKETMPTHLQKVEKSSSSTSFHTVYQNRQKLQQLISNHEQYRGGKISYQRFYDAYGRIDGNFKKNKQECGEVINLQPEIVEVVHTNPTKELKSASKYGYVATIKDPTLQKQVGQLKYEVHRLKKRQKELQKEKENQISSMRIQAEERISSMLKILKRKTEHQQLESLRQTLMGLEQKLIQQIKEKQSYRKKSIKLEEELLQMKERMVMLEEENERNRKIQLVNSHLSEGVSHLNFDAKSQNNAPKGNILKLEKIINNLNEEKNLLRYQLNRERQNLYRMQKNEKLNTESENYQNRKTIEKKNTEIAQLKKEMDKYKLQTLKIQDVFEKTQKQLEFQKTLTPKQNSYKKSQILKQITNHTISNKFSIDGYKGQGLEGFSYYELLSRQFKIRYRRSCLKEKELLYKSNGLEIGVISEFRSPNFINVVAHLTDFGQEYIKNLSIRVINSHENSVIYDKSEIEQIMPGEQIRLPIKVQIRNYPIGATVLVCEYQFYKKKQDFRLLLPVHIFKMMVVRPRDGEFMYPRVQKFRPQKKMIKERNSLSQYFKGCRVENDGTLRCCLIHEQTQTKLLLDVVEREGEIELTHEHRAGDRNITEYLLSTLRFLLKKEQ